jgi:hypothetical protein
MNAVKVSDIDSIHDLLDDARCVDRLARALQNATRYESAEEFLRHRPLKVRLGAAAAKKIGEEMGLQSRTTDASTLLARYGHALLALLCGLAEQGISLTEMGEQRKGEDCLLVATVPSSALSGSGELSAHLTGRQEDYRIEATVTFKGQKFAWGRGKRILKRLFRDVERSVSGFQAEGL